MIVHVKRLREGVISAKVPREGVMSAIVTYEGLPKYLARHKRNAVGALDIVTNHAQPIHAEVKQEGGENAKVTPPRDSLYVSKSLRKSLPLINTVDLIRSVSRVVTLCVLLISAIVEFFPMIQHLYSTIYNFMYIW
ncbi:uncharacterized protein ACR2FA_002244 [Aphomia sociella]